MVNGQKTQRLGSENMEIREKETTDRDQIQKLAKGDRIQKEGDNLFSVLAEYPQLIFACNMISRPLLMLEKKTSHHGDFLIINTFFFLFF